MASKVGIVESINDGKFFAKDSLGNTKELKNGDIIYENDVVFSDGSNSSNSEIRVALEGEDIIVLKNGVQQLFDSSLIASTFGDEEVVFTRKGLEALLQQAGDMTNVESDLRWTSFDDYVDITEEETTAGEEEEEILEEGSIGQFASRDGDITDIVSDLRKKSWIRTQNYKEVENSEALEKTSLKPLGENLDTIVSIPRPIAPNPIDTIIPIAPTPVPPTPETPIITPIANLSIDDITMYEQDGFMVFTVTLDIPASGNITVNFATSNGTAEAGKDYTPITGIITIPSGSSTAQIRVPINDDYYYEKSETFNVTLTNPTGNVNIVKPVGVGTILDNPPSNNKPLDPNKPDSETGTYGEEDSVYAIITGSITVNEGDKSSYTIKLVDKDGNPVVVDKNTDVTVVYKNISTQDNDTQYKNGDKITVTIPKGSSEVKFEVQTKDDFYADNGENFNLSIEKVDTNEFENVVIGDKNGKNKDVTTEILDNTTTNPNNPSTNEKEQEQVVLKIVAADKDGNPIKGTDGNYLTQNEVPEGSDVYYVVLAFKPDTTTFNDSTKLPIQEGKVEVETSNKTASGVNSQTKDDGTEDYISKKEIVELGKPISVKTLDDWKSDNNEQFEIKIIDKTYQHPSTPVYENVKTDTNPVTTTIKDDTDTTPNNPNDNKIETNQEQVILKIVACDSTGNPIIVNGKYTFANEVAEGSNAKYMVLAFAPNTTEFKQSDKLDIQGGTVTIKTTDGTAISTGTQNIGTKDFEVQTNTLVTLGQTFDINTLDDYIADNGEYFTVSINNNTYSHPSTPIYENVVTDTNPVTTTIKDNTTTGTEVDSEDVKIVLVAVTEADKDKTGDALKSAITKIDGTVDLDKNTNQTPEGGKLYYVAVAVDKDGKPLATQGGDVKLNYGTTTDTTDKDATAGTDYDSTKTTATIGTVFSVDAKDDYYAEGNEKFTVKITDLTNSPYETSTIDTTKDTVTSTITDNPANKDTSNPTTPIEPTSPSDTTP
ncbi:Calx-beta domain-containing protein, partial [Aliarcobacter cryaerophilus]|uniref:Calx-beta domain-containing protein n=1 Tax=Aliarcobacter cryaerophilus TaxID=28198 RepID=UPI003DA69E66